MTEEMKLQLFRMAYRAESRLEHAAEIMDRENEAYCLGRQEAMSSVLVTLDLENEFIDWQLKNG